MPPAGTDSRTRAVTTEGQPEFRVLRRSGRLFHDVLHDDANIAGCLQEFRCNFGLRIQFWLKELMIEPPVLARLSPCSAAARGVSYDSSFSTLKLSASKQWLFRPGKDGVDQEFCGPSSLDCERTCWRQVSFFFFPFHASLLGLITTQSSNRPRERETLLHCFRLRHSVYVDHGKFRQ